MAAKPPPPYSDPPPAYSHSLSATRSPTPHDEIGSSGRPVLRASPIRDAATASGATSSLTPILHTASTSPVISIEAHLELGRIEKEQDDLLGVVEKELDNIARLRREGPTTESSTAEAERRHGTVRRDTCVTGGEELSSPSVSMFRYVCSTDLLFLIDITSSMQPYIDAVRAQVKDIVANVNDSFLGQADVRTAIVGYRDHSDYPRIEYRDFKTSIDEVHSFLEGLLASGGVDIPEDVLGGLNQALDLTWSNQTRCIIHIADAPPHGTSLQNVPIDLDSYPLAGTEPHHLVHGPLLSRMIGLGINYALLRINDSTDRMAYVFAKAYAAASGGGKLLESNQYFNSALNLSNSPSGNGLLFEEFQLGTDYAALKHLVVKTVTASASRTLMRTPRKHRTGKAKTAAFMTAIDEVEDVMDVPIESVTPQWDKPGWLDETLEIAGYSPDWERLSEDTLDNMMSSDENIKMSRIQLTIRRRSRPFAQGAARIASYAGTSSPIDHFVAKAFKKSGKTFNHLIEDMKGQALCKAFALDFNASTGGSTQIDFIVTTCLTDRGKIDINSDEGCMFLEPYIPGEFVKYNGNHGWVNEDVKGQTNDAAQAFSHFSYERSRGKFMITDLQGVGNIMTDPSIQTRDTKRFRLNDTNYGPDGFIFFFHTHKCNAICEKLGLKSPRLMYGSEAWDYRRYWPKLVSTVCCSNRLCGKVLPSGSDKEANRILGLLWCNTCRPQLELSKVSKSCAAERCFNRKFKVSVFYFESRGQIVPQRCSRHRGDDVSHPKLSIASRTQYGRNN